MIDFQRFKNSIFPDFYFIDRETDFVRENLSQRKRKKNSTYKILVPPGILRWLLAQLFVQAFGASPKALFIDGRLIFAIGGSAAGCVFLRATICRHRCRIRLDFQGPHILRLQALPEWWRAAPPSQ